MLDHFVKQFTNESVDYIKINNSYFLKDEDLEKHLLSQKPTLFGLYLGKEVLSKFIPSFNLLDLMSKSSSEKVFVNDFGEIDFLYGKHLRKRHVSSIQGSLKKGVKKLVQNEFDENIGYGIFLGEQKNSSRILTHVLDRGVFIKRDKQLKK
jgi:ribosome biogenesis protein Nip4